MSRQKEHVHFTKGGVVTCSWGGCPRQRQLQTEEDVRRGGTATGRKKKR